jgi:hypothetical protein
MQPPDNFSWLLIVDFILHIPEKPFCWNPCCPCHEDELAIFQVSLFVQDGLMTPTEATAFVEGKGI